MLNQTSIYAVRAMGYLASRAEGALVLSSTIAEEMEIPANFLSKIIHRLSQAGLIQAVRGRNGGVALARDPGSITIREVVDLFMRIDDYKDCFLGMNKCNGACGLHIRWKIISEQLEKMLNDTTIDRIFSQ